MSERGRYIVGREIVKTLKDAFDSQMPVRLSDCEGILRTLVKQYDEAPLGIEDIVGMPCNCPYCCGVRAGTLPPRFNREKRLAWFEGHGTTEEEWEEQKRKEEEEERERWLTPNPS